MFETLVAIAVLVTFPIFLLLRVIAGVRFSVLYELSDSRGWRVSWLVMIALLLICSVVQLSVHAKPFGVNAKCWGTVIWLTWIWSRLAYATWSRCRARRLNGARM